MSVFDVPDAPRTRYYNASSVVGPEHVYTSIIQWEIEGYRQESVSVLGV